MKKAAVIYWSGTGNTETMAQCIAEGARAAGADVTVYTAAGFSPEQVQAYDAFAFGCPAMGAEELEDAEFAPMWDRVKDMLGGKKVVLFGSCGWGEGEWMQAWAGSAPCPIAETYVCNETPGPDEQDACLALGRRLNE